jgi:hypothetical protein
MQCTASFPEPAHKPSSLPLTGLVCCTNFHLPLCILMLIVKSVMRSSRQFHFVHAYPAALTARMLISVYCSCPSVSHAASGAPTEAPCVGGGTLHCAAPGLAQPSCTGILADTVCVPVE